MKKILLIIFLAFTLNAYEKPTLLMLYSSTCQHCADFANNTLVSSRVRQSLSNYNVIAINTDEQKDIPYDIDFTGYVPSFHILNNEGIQLANTITGNIPANEFSTFLDKFIELYRKFQESYKNK